MKKVSIITALAAIVIMAGAVSAEEQAVGDPGVQLSVKTQAGEDLRVSKRIALAVAKGESPTSLLAAGQYTATWKGLLSIEKRERVYFSFEGNGAAELFVDGESVLKGGVATDGAETERLRLNSGLVPIKVIYTSPEDGAGTFRLNWRGRDFSKEPVPALLLKHQPSSDLKAATLVRRGRTLFAELKCSQCHDGGSGMPEVAEMAPSLAGVGDRLDAGWMEAWLKDPKSMRSHARMPKLLTNPATLDQDAADIAAYLESLKAEKPATFTGDKAAGAQTFHDLGCIACHRSEKDQDIASWNTAPIDLFNAGHKYEEGALVAFLKEPGKHHPSTRMPDFELDDKEVANLAAFVRGLATTVKPSFHKGDEVKGKTLAASNHCAQCHDGVEKSTATYTPLAKLSHEISEDKSCLSAGHVAYDLNEQDAAAIKAFMKSEQAVKSLAYFNKAEYAHRELENLNCAACHQMDTNLPGLEKVHALSAKYTGKPYDAGGKGDIPPSLTFIGEKLRTNWLEDLFSGDLEYRTRPWQKKRMPAFPSRAKNLAEGFTAAYGVVEEAKPATPVELPGKTFYGMVGGFGCAACHGAAENKPLAVFEAPGVNLQFSGERLREDFYHRWMRDPRRIDPATIMPKYFVEENETTLSEPLDGDGEKQMEAIWSWMQELNVKK